MSPDEKAPTAPESSRGPTDASAPQPLAHEVATERSAARRGAVRATDPQPGRRVTPRDAIDPAVSLPFSGGPAVGGLPIATAVVAPVLGDLALASPEADPAAPRVQAGVTTTGLTAIDRARRGAAHALRVLVVGARDGGRLALAARVEGMAVSVAEIDAAVAAAGELRFHAILVDASAVGGGGEALVARLAEVAPATPIVVAEVAPGQGARWIDAGADDFLDPDGLGPALVRRAIEASVARARARDARRRREHGDRLAAIGRLASGVAHEVNNPAAYLLMNLRTCLDYLAQLRPGLDDARADGAPSATLALLDEMAEMLDDNVRGVERIVSVVQALRSYARRDPDELESVDVADVCRDAAGLVANQVRHLARLRLDLEDGLYVPADRRHLNQVIVNLLVNARDAVAERGGGDHEIAVETVVRGEWVVVRVSDTGVGIAPAVRDRIFEPFFTTKPRGAGSGLGLAIARDVVEHAGGRIAVESAPGRGSCFEVILPLETASGAASAAIEQPAERARVRLLVIDDEVALTAALRRQLRFHHEVEVANDGAAALALVDRVPFDVVLCDVMMPGMDGLAVHAALVRRHPRLADRLVFMTGGMFAEQTRRAVAALALPVLDKPVPLSSLLDAIDVARTR